MVGDNICCMRRISTKQKKKLYSISSLLFHLLVFIVLLVSLGTDSNEKTSGNSGKENSAVKENRTIAEKEPDATYKAFFTNIKH